ncbi:hypothetical protein ACP275_14G164000 [Erythranthe tilingii]
MEMIPQCDSTCQSTQTLDEAAVDISYRRSVRKSYDPQCTNDSCRNAEPSILGPEDEELIKDRSMDYAEKIKELHLYIDMVKKLVKPGCSSFFFDGKRNIIRQTQPSSRGGEHLPSDYYKLKKRNLLAREPTYCPSVL